MPLHCQFNATLSLIHLIKLDFSIYLKGLGLRNGLLLNFIILNLDACTYYWKAGLTAVLASPEIRWEYNDDNDNFVH